MMKYYKDENKKVYAYDDEQLSQITLINSLESKLSKADKDSEEYLQLTVELESIRPVFFEIRDKINSLTKMSVGEVELHINPPIAKEQLISEAEQQKQSLLAEANNAIAPLQDAIDLGMATDEEVSLLKQWKIYRVTLNRVDTSTPPDIDWPQKP